MARPTLNPEDRRKQIAVRFGPEARVRLEEIAEAEGISPGKVAESRASALLFADDKTFKLLIGIATEIAEIEQMAGGQKWHEDLTTWGMVAEMLARGPVDGFRPEFVMQDGGWLAAQREKAQIIRTKQDVIERLAVLGISASMEPSGMKRGRRGLFGGILSQYIDRRANEQALIDAIADDATRSRAQALHDEIRQLDASEADESSEMDDANKIYQDMEEAGRARWRRHNLGRLLNRVANYRLPTQA